MTKDGSRYKAPELPMKYALLAQPHIKAQRSRLDELIESRGHVVLRQHARYWPALLNFIEMVFARSKRLTRAWNNHKVARLNEVLPVSMGMGGLGAWRLESHAASETSHQPERLIRRFARKCRDRMRRMFLYMRAGGRWRQYGLRKAGRGLQRKKEDNQHQTKPGWGDGPDGTAWGR